MATEIDVGGIKFRGGKIFLILTVLSSFVGVLWGGFEVYSRYLSIIRNIPIEGLTGFYIHSFSLISY